MDYTTAGQNLIMHCGGLAHRAQSTAVAAPLPPLLWVCLLSSQYAPLWDGIG